MLIFNCLPGLTGGDMQIEDVIRILKENGCRITKQRRVIIEVILENDSSSCKDIYMQVMRRDKTIGMATVYRMIKQLEDLGIVNRIDVIELAK